MLFVFANMAIMAMILIVTRIFGVDAYLTKQGMNYYALLAFAMIVGFTGSFFSLLISKFIAKMIYSIKVITEPENEDERFIYNTVQKLAGAASIPMPEVGIYESPEANAFATGPTKRSSIVAVSSGLLRNMDKRQVEGVLAHEVSHIANGDMVTMTLLQGVLNTFVVFVSRVIGYVADMALRKDDDRDEGPGIMYYVVSIVCEIVLSIIASMIIMAYSRHREFKADASAAMLSGKDKMIEALEQLKVIVENRVQPDNVPALNSFKISGPSRMLKLFSTHPPLQDRIDALKNM